MSRIDTPHPQYAERLEQWRLIEDVTRLKNLPGYLRELNPRDKSKENQIRNRQYQEGAVFYPVAQQSAQGMVGTIFRKWPTLSVPPELEYMAQNADGGGISIYQSSQAACDDVLRKGRAGVWVHFPRTDGEVSRSAILSGETVPVIHRFTPEQIISWRRVRIGARVMLGLVVTREEFDAEGGDPYSYDTVPVYREMYLDMQSGAPVYRERIWSEVNGKLTVTDEATPTDGDGRPWDEIPFSFIGSENNDPECDLPPFLGMSQLNLGHYRNSAEYEDSVAYVGQAQPFADCEPGQLAMDQLKDMHEAGSYIGSRFMLPFRVGFAQPLPNMLAKEAMDAKMEAMIQIGARLMQAGSATKTATQAAADQDASTSLLSLVASNISEAYTQAIKWACRYVNADDSEVAYTLSQDFVDLVAEPQMAMTMMRGFAEGTVPLPDYTHFMRRTGLFRDDVSDEDYAALLASPGGGLDLGG